MPQRRDGSYPHPGTSVTRLRPRAACAEGDTDSGMSATPADVRLEENPRLQAHRRQGGLPLGASIYGAVIAVVALAVWVPVVLRLSTATHHWVTFGILAAGAAATQLYVVRTAKNTAFHTTNVFLISAAIL